MTRKRTQIYQKFRESDFVLGNNNGYDVPLSAIGQRLQKKRTSGLALCDLSAMSRAGFKSAAVDPWCEAKCGIAAPSINQGALTDNGLLIARLSGTEILMMEDLAAKGDFELMLQGVPAAYLIPRQDSHHCFMLLGQHCASLFSKLCAVDLRGHKFQRMQVAQTVMARVGVIVVRRDIEQTPAFYLLTDSSLAEYLWDCLLDAMQEFEGEVIGINDLPAGG
ncbi:MAG: hypothetical protein OXC69_01475 [Candidatus Tectomicrobia bacterium]|nr:hypothetical protein [Candidatus Tectomicrobia bacterium]